MATGRPASVPTVATLRLRVMTASSSAVGLVQNKGCLRSVQGWVKP